MHAAAVWTRRSLAAIIAVGCLFAGGFLAWHYPLAPAFMVVAFAVACVASFLRPEIWLFALPAALPAIGLASWSGWIAFEEIDIFILAVAAGGYAALVRHWRNRGESAARAGTSSVASSIGGDAMQRAGTHPSVGFDGVVAGIGAAERAVESSESPKDPAARPPNPNSAAGAPTAAASILSVRLSGFVRTAITLFLLSIIVGLYRGISSAATADFGWFGGYNDAINSLRVAKSFLFALLLYPLLRVEALRSGPRAMELLFAGLAVGLAVASMAVVWERIAFPGLLNFSADYRATALFWEMHVGGAALDGFLVLTLPFAVWQLLHRTMRLRWTLAAGLVLLAGYACLATFSRGVYLAVPISLGLLALLMLRQRRSVSASSAARALARGCALALAFAAAAHVVFRSGGYRALLAVLAVAMLTLTLRSSVRRISAGVWLAGLVLGCIGGAAGGLVARWIPKGNYVVFAAAFAVCAGLLWQQRGRQAPGWPLAAIAAYVWVIVAAAIVATGWGGVNATYDTSIVLLLVLAIAIWNTRSPVPRWSDDLRVQSRVAIAAALVAITVAVFGGGAYMGDRFVTSEHDLGGRLQHWHDGIAMLDTTTDWLVGKGIGRFPQSYSFNVRDRDFPGDYRIGARDGNSFLALFGPRRDAGFGELLRVSQRVSVVPGGRYTVVLDVRAPEAAELHVEICEKHLLYDDGCAVGKVTIDATSGRAQRKVVSFDGSRLTGGPWYAPRLAFFSIAVESPGHRVDVDDVSLLGPDGGELLVNGDFTDGMRRWFFTSDRLHLPWHIKNMGLAVLFDQGLFGLISLVLLVGIALGRLVAGRAQGHPAAPYLASALVGFLVVGAFDSLLDVPRLAFLFYLLVLVSLVLRGSVRRANSTAS